VVCDDDRVSDHYRLNGMARSTAAAGAVRWITEPVLAKLEQLHQQMSASTDTDEVHDLNCEHVISEGHQVVEALKRAGVLAD
jgi:DNA-binding GntR family transcriptional regulator